jgi:hypothetical protein
MCESELSHVKQKSSWCNLFIPCFMSETKKLVYQQEYAPKMYIS